MSEEELGLRVSVCECRSNEEETAEREKNMALQARHRFRPAPSIALLFILPLVSLCNTNSYQHFPESAVSYTGRCAQNWCGETWRANQILHYAYLTRTVQHNVSATEIKHDCSNAVSSLNCSEGVVDPTSIITTSEEVVERQLVNETRNAAILKNPGAIFTDNFINFGRDVNETNPTYPTNTDKVWQIRIPQGCRLTVLFDTFDVERTTECSDDYFSVQTTKKEDYRKYCDNLYRIEIRKRRRVQFIFHSNDSVSKMGISARMCFEDWPATENSVSCTCNPAVTTERRRRSSDQHKSLQLPGRVREEEEDEEAVIALRGPLSPSPHSTERKQPSLGNKETVLKHFENSEDPILRRLSQSYKSDDISSHKTVQARR